jgi:hypothetical protein
MSYTAGQTSDEVKSIETSPIRRHQHPRSTFGEPDRLLIAVLGSKAVYQVSAETFPPVTSMN